MYLERRLRDTERREEEISTPTTVNDEERDIGWKASTSIQSFSPGLQQRSNILTFAPSSEEEVEVIGGRWERSADTAAPDELSMPYKRADL